MIALKILATYFVLASLALFIVPAPTGIASRILRRAILVFLSPGCLMLSALHDLWTGTLSLLEEFSEGFMEVWRS